MLCKNTATLTKLLEGSAPSRGNVFSTWSLKLSVLQGLSKFIFVKTKLRSIMEQDRLENLYRLLNNKTMLLYWTIKLVYRKCWRSNGRYISLQLTLSGKFRWIKIFFLGLGISNLNICLNLLTPGSNGHPFLKPSANCVIWRPQIIWC